LYNVEKLNINKTFELSLKYIYFNLLKLDEIEPYWGLGIGPNPQSPIPNPQSPIPNPHYDMFKIFNII